MLMFSWTTLFVKMAEKIHESTEAPKGDILKGLFTAVSVFTLAIAITVSIKIDTGAIGQNLTDGIRRVDSLRVEVRKADSTLSEKIDTINNTLREFRQLNDSLGQLNNSLRKVDTSVGVASASGAFDKSFNIVTVD